MTLEELIQEINSHNNKVKAMPFNKNKAKHYLCVIRGTKRHKRIFSNYKLKIS